MKIIVQIFVCALLAALTMLVASAIQLVRVTTATISALPGEVETTRAALLGEVRAARQDVLNRTDRQMTALRQDAIAEADEIRQSADQRVAETLAQTDALVQAAQGLRSDLQPVLASAQGTLNDAGRTLHDADRTVDDLHPQLLGLVAASKITAGETAQTMRDFRTAVPSFIEQGQRISGNVDKATSEFSGVATNLNRLTKPKWYDRLLGYGLNGVIIYRDLNPVTSLTLKGVQFLTSH
jgi:multidrug resistance efflux pump